MIPAALPPLATEPSAAELARFFHRAPLAALVVATDGQVAHVNPAGQRLLGESVQRLLGRPWLEALDPTGAHAAALERLNSDESAEPPVEIAREISPGQWRWIRWTAAPSHDGSRLYFGLDVTPLVEAEAALQRVRDEALNACRAKSDFLANMSHEIRTPMTAILGYADLLVNEEGLDRAPPHRREALQAMQRNCGHLLNVVNDILDLSKIEAGRLEIAPVVCSPRELLEEVQQLYQGRAQARGLTLAIECLAPVPASVVTDPTRLRQVLFNLVGNALKFTESGGVTVRLRHTSDADQGDRLRYDVIDTGIGLSPEIVVRLFRPYSQADSSTSRRYGGTGLGLAISRQLAQLLGGDIEVVSQPGQGSVFTLTVACQAAPEAPQAAPTAKPVAGSTADGAAKPLPLAGLNLLLAEDGPDNQRLISYILTKAGAQVTLAENGRMAADTLLAADAPAFHVVLMDMQMPVLDGYSAVGELRAAGFSRPIIALTAHSMASDRDKCLAAGCDDYFTKPIDRHKLIQLVGQYAARS